MSGPVSEAADSAVSSGGPGTTAPGILLVVTPRPDATMDVTESVLLDAPTDALTVRPPDFSAAGAPFADEGPYASKFRVVARDLSVQVPDGVVNRPMTLELDEPARRFELRYELNRAVVRSKPSTTGRALGAVRPLTIVGAGHPGRRDRHRRRLRAQSVVPRPGAAGAGVRRRFAAPAPPPDGPAMAECRGRRPARPGPTA